MTAVLFFATQRDMIAICEFILTDTMKKEGIFTNLLILVAPPGIAVKMKTIMM